MEVPPAEEGGGEGLMASQDHSASNATAEASQGGSAKADQQCKRAKSGVAKTVASNRPIRRKNAAVGASVAGTVDTGFDGGAFISVSSWYFLIAVRNLGSAKISLYSNANRW